MKIGIDIRCVQLGHGQRGIGRYLFDLLDGLARFAPENDYVLFAITDLPLPERLTDMPRQFRIARIVTRRILGYRWDEPIPWVWRLRYLKIRQENEWHLERAVRRERLDLLHLPCVIDQHIFADGAFSCPVVKTFHDAIPLIFADQYLQTWPEAQRFVYRLQVQSFVRADAVVAISESARQDAVNCVGVSPDKIQIVYNAVSDEFQPVTDPVRLAACREKFRIRHPYFLFCSAPGYVKNREAIIEAFGRFVEGNRDPYQLVFVTPRKEDEMARLRGWAFDAGLTGRDFLATGFVSDKELASLYSGATALLSPSIYEGFGLPAAQAMAVGTPVIVSDRASQPEVVGDAGLLVDPSDAAAIVEAMRRLAGDPQLRSDLAARGRERVRRFSPQIQAEAMMAVYQRVWSARTAPSVPRMPVGAPALKERP